MDSRHFDAMTRTLATTTRRAALRGLAAALLGGVVAGSPVARRATSVRAGAEPNPPCAIDDPCDGFCDCLDPNTCQGDPPVCTAPAPPPDNNKNNNDNDKNKRNNRNNNGNGGNGGNGGNNGGDGIFWPCTIPWFASNPACNGTLGGLFGR
jgi:hypothetical protein